MPTEANYRIGDRCPTCNSPDPKRHPAMQFEGEVQMCKDSWHNGVPDYQQLCNHILEATGDNRSCVEPCGECGGRKSASLKQIARKLSGEMRCNCDLDNWAPERNTGHSHVCRIHEAALQHGFMACPACNGHGTTFRDDAKGRERIRLACGWWWVNAADPTGRLEAFKAYTKSNGTGLCRDWAWDNRHGQPWCDSLESHVRAYREDAPNYAADWNAMGRLLERLESCIEQIAVIAFNGAKHIEFRHFYHCILSDLLEITKPSEWPEAVVKAVYAALCEGE